MGLPACTNGIQCALVSGCQIQGNHTVVLSVNMPSKLPGLSPHLNTRSTATVQGMIWSSLTLTPRGTLMMFLFMLK